MTPLGWLVAISVVATLGCLWMTWCAADDATDWLVEMVVAIPVWGFPWLFALAWWVVK